MDKCCRLKHLKNISWSTFVCVEIGFKTVQEQENTIKYEKNTDHFYHRFIHLQL